MKILYISYDGMTDPLGQSQVLPYLLGLQEKGHEIVLVSCEKKEAFKQGKPEILKQTEGRIKWFPVGYSNRYPVISQLINLRGIRKEAVAILKKEQPEIVHCRSYMAALIGLALKKKHGIKFLFDMRGFWADERIDGRIWNRKNFIHAGIFRFFKKKELEFLISADHIISLTENAKEEILMWEVPETSENKISVIPCCTDLKLFSAHNVEKFKNLTLVYLGSVGTWYMLEEMLLFFKVLLKEKPEANFLFITKEAPGLILKEAAKMEIPLDRIIVKAAERNEVPELAAQAHLAVFFIKSCYSKKASSPTKLGELLSLGIPVITNSGIGDVDKIIKEEGAGFLINKFSEEEYHTAIERIEDLLVIPLGNLRAVACKYFSIRSGIEAYDKVYQELKSEKLF